LFFFEAFDEPWKGNGTEGHWGLFFCKTGGEISNAAVVIRSFMPSGPTSPSYEDKK